MNNEIKEKIYKLRAYLGTEENWLLNDIVDYITNLQEENRQTKLLKERYQIEKEDYKSRCEKATNEVIRIIEIILEQPSKDKSDDLWIISKLEGIQILLQGEDKE